MQTLAVSLDAMVFFIAKGKFSYGEEWMSSCVYTYGNLRFAAPVAEDEVLPQEFFVYLKSFFGLRLTEGEYQNPMTAGTDRKGESEK